MDVHRNRAGCDFRVFSSALVRPLFRSARRFPAWSLLRNRPASKILSIPLTPALVVRCATRLPDPVVLGQFTPTF